MFDAWKLLKQTVDEWQQDEAPRLGAALAYYALFSLAPLLVIVVFIIGFVYKGDTVGHIQRQVQSLVGADAAGKMSGLEPRRPHSCLTSASS